MSVDTQPMAPARTTLDIDDLLDRRAILRAREQQLSYWRRVVQGRLDLLAARSTGERSGRASLAHVLGGPAGTTSYRTAHSTVQHSRALPELALADSAWDALTAGRDDAQSPHATVTHLVEAERWLSVERSALLGRLDATTRELAHAVSDDPDAYLRSIERRWVASPR